ncbi:hypothetical protein FRC04_000723 [Tulasnella sp. 424]|nr:hypothetical protein FRC04_000723 [Tulasnella sp. 424]KAG8968587.1 hypothetical protein FRC05_001512 [Tulasnella sp. 425]
MSSFAPAAPHSTGESPRPTTELFRCGPSALGATLSFVNLPPQVIIKILGLLKISDILCIRQTCKHLFQQTKSQNLWARIAQQLLHSHEIIWPSWALPLHAIPAETIEDLVVRTKRLAATQRNVSTDDDSGGKDIRTSFEGVIIRPRDSPIWLHLIRGRWLLVQLNDFTLELWDLDDTNYANPAATCSRLKGFVDGIMHVDSGRNVEITISSTSFTTYKFAPELPFKCDPQPSRPTLTVVNSFEGHSTLKAKAGRLLAFAECSGNRLRACIIDESTLNDVELSIAPGVVVVRGAYLNRNLNLELYSTFDVEEALSRQNLATRSANPFQSLTYPGVSPLLHNPKFYINPPSYLQASSGSVVLMRFIDNFWQALILQPQQPPANVNGPRWNYKVMKSRALATSLGSIHGVSFGENGYRSAILGCDRVAVHYAKTGDRLCYEGAHTLVSWMFPDIEFDLPRPRCVAFDEAAGVCVTGMGSGRIWIGDAVPRWEMKKVDVPSIPNQMPHPDPRWPQLPSFYFWDRGYRGPHSDTDLVGEVAPGWSTAVDYYIPWRNEPRMYGGIQWFVENVMGIPGPARTVLFSTKLLARDDIGRWAEFVDVNGRMFLVSGDPCEHYFEVNRVVDGLTLADVIERLNQKRSGTIVVREEDWASDCMALDQHRHWYKASDLSKQNK